MRVRRIHRLVAVAALIGAAACLAVFDFLPSLRNVKAAQRDLRSLEFRVAGSFDYKIRYTGQETDGGVAEVPKTPDLTMLMAGVRSAQEATGVSDLTFETVQNDERESSDPADPDATPYSYLVSVVDVSFSAGLKEGAAFMDELTDNGVNADITSIAISRSQDERQPACFTILLQTYAIPE